jgi:hypothetical protein
MSVISEQMKSVKICVNDSQTTKYKNYLSGKKIKFLIK